MLGSGSHAPHANRLRQASRMQESEAELGELQALLDDSLARATGHLRSIVRPDRSLTAAQLAGVITGMCTLAVSSVTAAGEPRISGADGHFLHGCWVFSTERSSAKARQFAARPAISAAHLRGDDLGVFTHGRVEELNPATGPGGSALARHPGPPHAALRQLPAELGRRGGLPDPAALDGGLRRGPGDAAGPVTGSRTAASGCHGTLGRMALRFYIPSPPVNGFHLGPAYIHFYGLMYVIGITLAILITQRRWKAVGGDPGLVGDVALWAVPAGIVGGRIYFDLTTPKYIPHHWYGVLAVWDGGLGIWGGIALAAVVGSWRVHRSGASVTLFMNAVAPALLVAQAVGRVGNYFNQELFGGPTTLPWALHITPGFRPAGYTQFQTFHPTFLYEFIFDLLWAAVLVWLGHHRNIRPPGLFALYVAGYSAFRIFEESLRVDPSEHFLGLRLNMYVASVLTVAGVIWFIYSQRHGRPAAELLARRPDSEADSAGTAAPDPAAPGTPADSPEDSSPAGSGGAARATDTA